MSLSQVQARSSNTSNSYADSVFLSFPKEEVREMILSPSDYCLCSSTCSDYSNHIKEEQIYKQVTSYDCSGVYCITDHSEKHSYTVSPSSKNGSHYGDKFVPSAKYSYFQGNFLTESQTKLPSPSALNSLWDELNAETASVDGYTNRSSDAEMLFPLRTKLKRESSQKLCSVSSLWNSENGYNQNNGAQKVFNVQRFPKAAFGMVPRKHLARQSVLAENSEADHSQLLICEDFNERKSAFGTKRDDLFYKTIGRDVRKYLQEKFQVYLGNKSLNEIQKNGTFLKYVRAFFNSEVAPKLNSSSNHSRVLAWVATLISYNLFSKLCEEHLKELCLKIHDSLHNFTKVKLINLCKIEEFKSIFNYYSGEMEEWGFSRFTAHRTMKANIKGYKYAFSDISREWF